MRSVHPTAIVSRRAYLGQNVEVGPFCVIEDDAVVGDGCHLAARAVVKSDTVMGCDNQVAEGAILGGRPQHLQAGEQVGRLRIGNRNVIRENATIHRALKPKQETWIGDDSLIMVNAHVGHDCILGDHVILANNVMLAGHVSVAERAYLSGAVGVHQFCRIGKLAMVGGQAHANQDVPPYVTVDGRSSLIVGLNVIGLRRAGFSASQLHQLKSAYRVLFRNGLTWVEALDILKTEFTEGPAADFHPFLEATKRGIIQERRVPRGATVPLPSQAEPLDTPRVRRVG
jgi:UDP-N-acetylglucosamine acyltransferase